MWKLSLSLFAKLNYTSSHQYTAELDWLLILVLDSNEFNMRQFLDILTVHKDFVSALIDIPLIFTHYIKYQKDAYKFYKEIYGICSEDVQQQLLQLVVTHKQYKNDTEHLATLAKVGNLKVIRNILQLDSLVLNDVNWLLDLILSKYVDHQDDALSVLTELLQINFKMVTTESLLSVIFTKLENQNIHMLLHTNFMDAWCRCISQMMSNQVIELIKFLLKQVKVIQKKEIPTRLLILTTIHAKTLLSQKETLDALFDECWAENISSHLLARDSDADDSNVANTLTLHCALMEHSFDYWKTNCDLKTVKKIIKYSGGTPELLADMIGLHMYRLVNHSMDPPKDDLEKSLKMIDKLLKLDTAVFNSISRHLPSYCHVADEDRVKAIVDHYIINIHANPLVSPSFLEILPVRDLLISRFFNRLQVLTEADLFGKLKSKCKMSEIYFALMKTESDERISNANVDALLEWFLQFPAMYFNASEHQLIQVSLHHLTQLYSCAKIFKICMKLQWTSMKHFPDSLLSFYSPKILESYIENTTVCDKTAKILELTIRKVLQRYTMVLHKNALVTPPAYINNIASLIKNQLKEGNTKGVVAFLTPINDYIDNTESVPEDFTSTIKSLIKRIQKFLDDTGEHSVLLPILYQLCRWYAKSDPVKVTLLVNSIPQSPQMALFLLEWNSNLSLERMVSLYASIATHPADVQKALNIFQKRGDASLFKTILTYHDQQFEDSLSSFAIMVEQEEKSNLVLTLELRELIVDNLAHYISKLGKVIQYSDSIKIVCQAFNLGTSFTLHVLKNDSR